MGPDEENVIEQTLVKAEEVSASKERTPEQVEVVVNGVYNLLQSRIPEDFDKNMKNNDMDRVTPEQLVNLVKTQGYFSRSMNIMRMQQHYEEQEVFDLVWGAKKDSLVSRLTTSKRSREFALMHMEGPIGNVTFYDVLRKAIPKVGKEVKLSELIAPAEIDIKQKTDLVARWDGNYGKKVIRIIQLKVDRTPIVTIDEITEDNSGSRDMGVSKETGKKMLEYVAHLKRQNPQAEVRAFVMGLPSIDTGGNIINHTFGTINDNTQAGVELIEAARQEMFRTKFV